MELYASVFSLILDESSAGVYLDDSIELLRHRRVDGFDLPHRSGIGIDLEEITVIRRISAEEGIMDRRVYAVHVDRLYFLGRDVEYAR